MQAPKQPRTWAMENLTSASAGTPPSLSYMGCQARSWYHPNSPRCHEAFSAVTGLPGADYTPANMQASPARLGSELYAPPFRRPLSALWPSLGRTNGAFAPSSPIFLFKAYHRFSGISTGPSQEIQPWRNRSCTWHVLCAYAKSGCHVSIFPTASLTAGGIGCALPHSIASFFVLSLICSTGGCSDWPPAAHGRPAKAK